MYLIKQRPEDFIVEEIPLREPGEEGSYTYFLLEKRECNTEEAIQRLSKQWKIPRKRFGYAGNKDRNAITKQYCCVLGRIEGGYHGNFSVNVVGRGDEPISLGDLKGNRFTITIRNIDEKPAEIREFVNYFGRQRFSSNNFDIGLSILKKDFKGAAELIDYSRTRQHLKENPNNFVGGVRKVPFKILKLYVHAVQSRLWNEAAAELKERRALPLVSFDTEFEDEEIEELYDKLLKKYGLIPRDFVIREIPHLTPMGSSREIIADVNDLKIGDPEDDELNKGRKKCVVRFELGKGSYATVVIKKMFS